MVGLATIGTRLFVLRCDPRQQIAVYDTETFAALRPVTLPCVDFDEAYGLASCPVNKCLYVSNFKRFSVLKIELVTECSNNSPVASYSSWSVALEPTSLHVNRAANVLVACRGAQRLQEFTAMGSLVREISLPPELPSPWSAIELTSGQFAVSGGHKVSLVDADGRVVISYGNASKGSGKGQFNFPVGLAEMKNGSVLVVNRNNNCISILKSSFDTASDLVLPTGRQLLRPWAICLDESRAGSRGRLYVGEFEGGRILVLDDVCNFTSIE